MAEKRTAKKSRAKRPAAQEGTPPGGAGVQGSNTPLKNATDSAPENLLQCEPPETLEDPTTEDYVWEVRNPTTGEVIDTFPAKPRDGKQALFIVPGCPIWDDAARDEASAICKRFSKAWHELVLCAKLAYHEEARARLGRILGRFYAKIASEVAHADDEINDFSALYFGLKFFGDDETFRSKNEAFRKTFDKHRKSPVKRGDRRVARWVAGQLACLQHEGLTIHLHVDETKKWPTREEMNRSPAWKPETLKYAVLGFELSALMFPPIGSEVVKWEKNFGFNKLWSELLKPHLAWAWPKFIKEEGYKLRGGRGYARTDFGHHESTVRRFAIEAIAMWDSVWEP
jgi:hypothetical protein